MCPKNFEKTGQKFRANILLGNIATMPQTANAPAYVGRQAVPEDAVPAGKWIAKWFAELSRTVLVSNCRNRPMFAMSARTEESVRWTEFTT